MPLRMDVFDEIENIVFNYVMETYFSGFKLSPLWTKLFQFLYMTERKVEEDDFILFRGESLGLELGLGFGLEDNFELFFGEPFFSVFYFSATLFIIFF
jgi:hypothetical protein